MKYYYAIFTEAENAIEAEFPDLPGCVTFGDTYEETYENAVDVLSAWLGNAEPQFIKKPSVYKDFENIKGKIVPIPVYQEIIKSYQSEIQNHELKKAA